jgi:hypothetical protein
MEKPKLLLSIRSVEESRQAWSIGVDHVLSNLILLIEPIGIGYEAKRLCRRSSSDKNNATDRPIASQKPVDRAQNPDTCAPPHQAD